MSTDFNHWSTSLPKESQGKTIAALLREHVEPTPSWKVAKGWIHTGKVFLDGQRVDDPGTRFETGSVLEVRMSAPRRAPVQDLDEDAVLYIDEDIVVVVKPVNMQTFDQHQMERDTLEHRVRGTIQRLRKGKASAPVYAVYSVDERASGAVMFARSPEIRKKMLEQWNNGSMRRNVCAIVAGEPQEQRFHSKLVHDRGDGYRGSISANSRAKNAQLAMTDLEVIQAEDGVACVWCRTKTNRPHQVRIQLSENGTPVLGDYVYQKGAELLEIPPFWKDIPTIPRLALHVTDLRFIHPKNGRIVQVRAPLPKDFTKILKKLGLDDVHLPRPESVPTPDWTKLRAEEKRRREEEKPKKKKVLPPSVAARRGFLAVPLPPKKKPEDAAGAEGQNEQEAQGEQQVSRPERRKPNQNRGGNQNRKPSNGRGQGNRSGGDSRPKQGGRKKHTDPTDGWGNHAGGEKSSGGGRRSRSNSRKKR